MNTLHFDIHIQAPCERVWERMLLDDAGYRDWTSAFCPGSYYEGRWESGAEMRFLSPSGDGMHSRVLESHAPTHVRLQHLGELRQGLPHGNGDAWAGAEESYHLEAQPDGSTHLHVHMHTTPAFEAMLLEMWPAALQRLKALCERDAV